MIVLVCGGRNFKNKAALYFALDALPFVITKIVNGAARGADSFSTQYAKEKDIPYKEYPADWSLGKIAGHLRNSEMLQEENIDLVIAFPGGSGTKDMKQKSIKAKKEVLTVEISKDNKVKLSSSFGKEQSILRGK